MCCSLCSVVAEGVGWLVGWLDGCCLFRFFGVCFVFFSFFFFFPFLFFFFLFLKLDQCRSMLCTNSCAPLRISWRYAVSTKVKFDFVKRVSFFVVRVVSASLPIILVASRVFSCLSVRAVAESSSSRITQHTHNKPSLQAREASNSFDHSSFVFAAHSSFTPH